MTRAAVLIAVVCTTGIALAQTSANDFARGAAIRADGGSIYRVPLTDDVYDTSIRPDLGDVRVLNAAGEAVPHALREAPRPANPEAEWRSVPSFPLTNIQNGGAARTQVRVGADGAVLEVTNDTATRQATTAYLVDTSSIDRAITRIALAWEAAPDTTFVARVGVEGSNDLNAWRTLVASTALAQLRRDGNTLAQSEIDVPGGASAKYLRITWPKELAAVTLASVRVRPRAPDAAPDIRWRTLSPAPGERASAAAYDTQALLPVQYVRLAFIDPTDTATVTIRSRPDASADWAFRHSGLFYSLTEGTDTIRNEPARIAPVTDRYWSVETTRDGGWTRPPRLEVGWHPHELVFLAQGAPPYTLVYGSARVGAGEAPVDALLAALDDDDRERRIRPATLEAPRTLGGADALTPAPPVRRIALWSVLIVAVGVLAWFAMRAFRETRPTTP
jgi:hypothetical protein